MEYLIVKTLHILSSTILFGTGIGTAFYMLFLTLDRARDIRAIAAVNKWVVRGDWLFTGTTGILQPLTGFWLIHLAGYPMNSRWIVWSLILYVVAFFCWAPVVWLQIRLRDLAQAAVRDNTDLPPLYWRYLWTWVALGIPAFFALVIVFYLMVSKPT